MKRVIISIRFKNDKGEPNSATSLQTEVETDSPAELVRDVLEAVKRHTTQEDLQIPLFGNGNVMISELPAAVGARGKAAGGD